MRQVGSTAMPPDLKSHSQGQLNTHDIWTLALPRHVQSYTVNSRQLGLRINPQT